MVLPEVLGAPAIQLQRVVGVPVPDLAAHVVGDGGGVVEHGVEHQELGRAARSSLQPEDRQGVAYQIVKR